MASVWQWPSLRAAAVLLLCLTAASSLPSDATAQKQPICGTWQADYTALQQSILNGQEPPRYAVAVSTHQGFADQLLGVVTMFYFALLTGRAFQITTGGLAHKLPLEMVYAQPNINWTATHDYVQFLRHHKGEDSTPPPLSYVYHYLIMAPIDDKLPDWAYWLKARNATELAQPEEVVMVLINRGSSQHLFRNPYIEGRLAELGLREDTAFGCALDFLFDLQPEVRQLVAQELAVLSHSSSLVARRMADCGGEAEGEGRQAEEDATGVDQAGGALTIGIQVRAGDEALEGGAVDWEALDRMGFFTCAQQIEDAHRAPGQQVVWYLLSDSLSVRQTARERYGDKVMTQVAARVQHTANHDGQQPRPGQEALSLEGMRTAVGEHWAFGMTDFQVITKMSGFGRTAAFRSLRARFSIYTVHTDTPVECSPGKHTSLTESSATWSGIR